MKEILKVFKRFIPPYKWNVLFSFAFNILSAFFSSLALVLSTPILEVLFDATKEVLTLMPWELSKDVLVNNLYYYVTLYKQEYGSAAVIPFIGVLMLFTTFLKVGCAYLAAYQTIIIRNGVVRDIRVKIYNKLMELPLSFYSNERKGDVMARATGDVGSIEASIMSSLDMFFKNPIIIIVSLGFMFAISAKLTLYIFIVLPVAGWIIGRTGKSLKGHSRKSQYKMGDLLGIIEESLSGLRIIKAFNAEKKMKGKYASETESYRKIQSTLQKRYQLAHPVSEFLGTTVIVVILWIGASLIGQGEDSLSGATFIAYIGIFYTIINPAKAFSSAYYNIQTGLAAVERIDAILLADNKIKDKENAQELKVFTTSIEYKNISFAYEDTKVLKNVSLSVPKGTMVALVGQSGSGKTTFVDLLPRFHDVQEGCICIDGIDIRDMKIHDLRELMGNVNQEAILFNDTFYNNIAFGVENATQEDVERAAKVANAHDFIVETEDGYQTNIGDRGGKLSGGQRQRISIARAVLKNPDILILDEATSALDTESERLVQDALENLMKNRTTLVIAHRLSTVRNADVICVFNQGEIIEQGTHEELIAKDGAYKKLHALQMD